MASLPPVFPAGSPQSSATGVPIHLLRMPPSRSPIPSYALAPMVGPVYTMAMFPATMTLAALAPTTGAMIHYGGAVQQPSYTEGFFYGGVDGPLLYGGNMQHHHGASSSAVFAPEPATLGVSHGTHPSCFYKSEFPMPGSDKPLSDPFAEKMLTHQVSAAVRLQAAMRGLLAHRWVREIGDLQLIQPYTPS